MTSRQPFSAQEPRGWPGGLLPRAFVKQGLEDWFSLHLSSMDAALSAHLKRMGAAACRC